MHFRIPLLLALATGTLADFGYELWTSRPDTVKARNDNTCPAKSDVPKVKVTAASSSDVDGYQECKSIASGESWQTFRGTAPALDPKDELRWVFQLFQNDDCTSKARFIAYAGKCLSANPEGSRHSPHQFKSFKMFKQQTHLPGAGRGTCLVSALEMTGRPSTLLTFLRFLRSRLP